MEKDKLRHELRVFLGKMDLRDDAKIEKCLEILGMEPEKKTEEPVVVITDQPKKRKKNSGDPE